MSRPDNPAPRVLVLQSSRMAHHPRHHYRLAVALQDAGYDVLMLAQPDLTPGHVDAVPMEYLPLRRGRFGRMMSGPLTMWRALRHKPDAIYIVSLDLLPWGVLARLLRRQVVVYDSNEEYDTYMLIKEWIPDPLRPLFRRVVRWAEPWLASKLSAATTALPATQEKFESAGVNAVHVRNFPPASLAEGAGERPETFDFDILIGGSLPDDQMPLLADTAAELEARGKTGLRWLVVARNYGDRERELLISELEAKGVRHLFELRYNLPFLEMQGVMRSSRIAFLLYPGDINYAARIPIRIFEYMAAGVPFVGPDLPTTAQFVEGLGVADLSEATPAAYADTLAALLDDPARQAEMSRRGPEVYRERYNWERESAKLVELFASLLPDAPPAAAEQAQEPARA